MSYYTFLPKLLNMTLTASVVIVIVLVLRAFLKKAPKAILCALWLIVLFRLLCPVSIQTDFSAFSLLNVPTAQKGAASSAMEYIPENIVHTEYPSVSLPVPVVSEIINEALPQGEEQTVADPLEGPLFIATCVWMIGATGMLIYSLCAYGRLREKMEIRVPLRENIYLADDIDSPFVVGLFRPKIYLPCGLEEEEREYVILHEKTHIRHLDHVVKLLAFLALTVHWFNPLVWLAFVLASKDMEMRCDEAVLQKLGGHIRADYCASLLRFATGRRLIVGMPLAFGEGDPKGRIKNLDKWKKPALLAVIAAAAVCIVLAACLLTNPARSGNAFRLVQINYDGDYTLVYKTNLLQTGSFTVEEWRGGVCSQTQPISITPETESLQIQMTVMNETDRSTGVQVGITPGPDGDSYLSIFTFPEDVSVRGWSYYLERKQKTVLVQPGEEIILGAMTFDVGSGVQVYPYEALQEKPERLEQADYMIVVRATLEPERTIDGRTVSCAYEGGIIAEMDAGPRLAMPLVDIAYCDTVFDDELLEITAAGSTLSYQITYTEPVIILEIGLLAGDGTEISATVKGGEGSGSFDNLPVGSYRFFVRNVGCIDDIPGKTVEGGALFCKLVTNDPDLHTVSYVKEGGAVPDSAASELLGYLGSYRRTRIPNRLHGGSSPSEVVYFRCEDGSLYTLAYQYYSGFSFNPAHYGEDDYRSILRWHDAEGKTEKAWKMENSFDDAFDKWIEERDKNRLPGGNIVVSGRNVVRSTVFPVGTNLQEILPYLRVLTIAPEETDTVPFAFYCDGFELSGAYSIFDIGTGEALRVFSPSGLAPQTYLFQNAEYGKDYIVTMTISDGDAGDMYCFIAHLEPPADG